MMKAFLIVVSSLCLCGILLCFWAYATGHFPMSKTTQPLPVLASVEQSTTGEADPQCPPCVERLASLLEVMEQEWDVDMTLFFEQSAKPSETTAHGWVWLSSEQREQPQQLIDQYGTAEGLRRLREIDSEAARRFESDKARPGRERRNPPAHDTSDDAASTQ